MIRVGVGGWSFAPWRDNFYPKGLKHSGELAYAATKLGAIEINGTFHRPQSPASFAKWRDETPPGFVFTIKGHRAVVTPRQLAGSGEAIGWFLASGVLELGDKLGPFLWQLAHTKKFDAEDIAAFCALLPREAAGRPLRHALEVRSDTFLVPQFVDIARQANVAIVFADSADYPMVGDLTSDFVYARLQKSAEDQPTGYAPRDLDRFATLAKVWDSGGDPDDVPHVGSKKAPKKKRDVFAFMISGAKVRAPAAAMALIERL
jgi:uncharacterized protein YecE (DUF72 family)